MWADRVKSNTYVLAVSIQHKKQTNKRIVSKKQTLRTHLGTALRIFFRRNCAKSCCSTTDKDNTGNRGPGTSGNPGKRSRRTSCSGSDCPPTQKPRASSWRACYRFGFRRRRSSLHGEMTPTGILHKSVKTCMETFAKIYGLHRGIYLHAKRARARFVTNWVCESAQAIGGLTPSRPRRERVFCGDRRAGTYVTFNRFAGGYARRNCRVFTRDVGHTQIS